MADPIRSLTKAEVAFFREHGWLHARGLATSWFIERLAAKAAVLRGVAGTPAVAPETVASYGRRGSVAGSDPDFAAAVRSPVMADNAARLLPGRPAVRLRLDSLIVRDPATTPGDAPVFHQDLAWMPMDRSRMLTVWLALAEVRAADGGLWFIDRSHVYGNLGRTWVRPDDDLRHQHPWLTELGLSPALDFTPGDATIHHSLTVHGVDENRGLAPRIALAWTYFDAATLYTGAPHEEIDRLNLAPGRPFEHVEFPLVGAEPAVAHEESERIDT
jgi:Phytanoyl-CoA dioxygenase (PhyH)